MQRWYDFYSSGRFRPIIACMLTLSMTNVFSGEMFVVAEFSSYKSRLLEYYRSSGRILFIVIKFKFKWFCGGKREFIHVYTTNAKTNWWSSRENERDTTTKRRPWNDFKIDNLFRIESNNIRNYSALYIYSYTGTQ